MDLNYTYNDRIYNDFFALLLLFKEKKIQRRAMKKITFTEFICVKRCDLKIVIECDVPIKTCLFQIKKKQQS